MKLNKDCVRDVLLMLEEKLTLDGDMVTGDDELTDALKRIQKEGFLRLYNEDEIIYTLEKLNEGGFIESEGTIFYYGVKSISYKGHTFLDNIRNDEIWKQLNEKIKETVDSASISIMSDLANHIIWEKLIK